MSFPPVNVISFAPNDTTGASAFPVLVVIQVFGIGSNLQGNRVTAHTNSGTNDRCLVGLDGLGLVKSFVVIDECVRVLPRKGGPA